MNTTERDISALVLTPRQLRAGLCILEDEDRLYLTTSGGRSISILGIHSDKQFIQDEADKYLKEIDWQDA